MRQHRSAWVRIWLALLLTLLLLQGAASTVHGSTYSDAVLADNPERYYRLGESTGTNADDLGSAAQDGTYTSGVTLGASGAISGDGDTAVTFDGVVDDYIGVPGMAIGSASFTVELWIKPSGSTEMQVVFAAVAGWGSSENLIIRIYDTGMLRFGFTADDLDTATGAVAMNEWSHVVCEYDSVADISRIFVNGIQVATGMNGPLIGSPVLFLGSWANSLQYYDGALDEVALYSTVLSEEQIQAHYVAAGYTLPPTPTPSPTATATLTPTPPPWALATLPGNGQTYLVSYEVSVGDVAQFLALLIIIALSLIQILIAMASRR